jgi:peroxiredoxin
MLKQWALRAIAGGLLAVIAPAWFLSAEAAQVGGCDAEAEPANLNFTMKDMSGQDVALSSYKGTVILLNFWATWCGPCRIEIPGFVELYKKYESQGLVVLGLSVDDPVSKLRTFAEELKMDYPILIGDGRDDVKNAFPLLGLPTTFIIGRDGTICSKHTGLALQEQLEPIIQSLLQAR